MTGGNAEKADTVWENSKIHEESVGVLLEKNGVDEILRFLSKKGYRSTEASKLQKEMEWSMRKYGDLIENQKSMPGKDKTAESVVKYYLFQLERLRKDLPYDAMGCEPAVPLMLMQEFQKESIAEDISAFLGTSEDIVKEELTSEIHRFVTVHLDPRGKALYMELLEHGNSAE